MWSFCIMLTKYKKYDDYISGEKSQKINECQKTHINYMEMVH